MFPLYDDLYYVILSYLSCRDINNLLSTCVRLNQLEHKHKSNHKPTYEWNIDDAAKNGYLEVIQWLHNK